jgi:hypothetical protein
LGRGAFVSFEQISLKKCKHYNPATLDLQTKFRVLQLAYGNYGCAFYTIVVVMNAT